jgi:hypothetical protein
MQSSCEIPAGCARNFAWGSQSSERPALLLEKLCHGQPEEIRSGLFSEQQRFGQEIGG